MLITGSGGWLGKELTKILEERNVPYKGTSRNPKYDDQVKVDLNSGDGLDEALKDSHTIIHLASGGAKEGEIPDSETTLTLLEHCRNFTIRHFMYVSIVGIDKIDFPYYKEKLKCEELVKESGLPYTILRATQFHDFAEVLLDRYVKRPFGFLMKNMKFQSIETAAVARKLLEISQAEPINDTINQGGPEILRAGAMAKSLFAARKEKSFIVGLPALGSLPVALKKAYNTCNESDKTSITWVEYLKRKYTCHSGGAK